MGEALFLTSVSCQLLAVAQAGGRRFDPVPLHSSGIRGRVTERAAFARTNSLGNTYRLRRDSVQLCVLRNAALKAVGSLTIREGKAHLELMRF